MAKWLLLTIGATMLLLQLYVLPFGMLTQYIIFGIGIVLLGIPHGSADMLIAHHNAVLEHKAFSIVQFLVQYLTRVAIFAILFYISLPLGLALFILCAAYHFGETDLSTCNTKTPLGIALIMCYGLLILNVLLLQHITDVREILTPIMNDGIQDAIQFVIDYKHTILSVTALLFFMCTFAYCVKYKYTHGITSMFFVQLACLLLVIYYLPLIMGFTFYFVVWHSYISLQSIFKYLHKSSTNSYKLILKNITVYSAIALTGIIIIAYISSYLTSYNDLVLYTLLGLGVLTAPHMHIMQDMYMHMRSSMHGSHVQLASK